MTVMIGGHSALGNIPPDGASVHACAITINYSSGVSKIPRQVHE